MTSDSIANILTVDLEDWVQSVYDPNANLTDCFIRNTYRLLELLAERNAKATFFVLGLCAERAPLLIRAVQSAGHDIQSHGFGHRLIHTQTPAEFAADILRSQKLLEDLVGKPIIGYRAPGFSITRKTLWALDVLAQNGFQYDSSIFPIRMRRYGLSGSPRTAYRIPVSHGQQLLELPVATLRLLGMTLPTGGGGYFRCLPYYLLQSGVRQANAAGHPAILYFHPYELAADELEKLSIQLPLSLRWHQGLGRKALARRLQRMLLEFPFTSIEAAMVAFNYAPTIQIGHGFHPREMEQSVCTAYVQDISFPALS